MNQAFSVIQRPFLPAKPRTIGLTMVLDKGMGAAVLADWLATTGDNVDIVKFG